MKKKKNIVFDDFYKSVMKMVVGTTFVIMLFFFDTYSPPFIDSVNIVLFCAGVAFFLDFIFNLTKLGIKHFDEVKKETEVKVGGKIICLIIIFIFLTVGFYFGWMLIFIDWINSCLPFSKNALVLSLMGSLIGSGFCDIIFLAFADGGKDS